MTSDTRSVEDVPTTIADSALQPGDLMTRGERVRLVLTLGALIALGPLTIDTYLPALPAITTDLETTESAVQLTLTGTLLGLALGQLLIGPWADAVGRKKPAIAGVGIHVLASVLCGLAPNMAMLGVFRVLQGLGAAAGTVVAMAVVRDLYTGGAAATLISRLMLVMGAAPILAPTLGSQILRVTEWRGIFVALAVLGLLILAVVAFRLPETLPPQRRRPATAAGSIRGYAGLFRDRTFMGLVLVAGLTMSALFAYVSGSSFVFQDIYGLDEQAFGFVFGAGAVGLIAGTQINAALLKRYEPQQVLAGALSLAGLTSFALVAVAATGFGGLPGLLVPIWLLLLFGGLSMPNAGALALSLHGEKAGSAAAVQGSLQFGIAAVAAPLVGLAGNDALGMAVVMGGGMMLAAVVMLLTRRSPRLAVAARTAAAPA